MKNSKQKKGDLGQHWTPPDIVRLMTSMIEHDLTKACVLEPTAGSGRFVRPLSSICPQVQGIEIDSKVVPQDLLSKYYIQDFFDWEGGQYEVVIGNPPYVNGRLLQSNPASIWGGELPATANLYLHVIEKAAKLHMKQGSELIFIVPNTFLSGTSMGRRLRRWMCSNGAFTHHLQPTVSWDSANVETCVFRWVKGAKQVEVKTERGARQLFHNDGMIKLIKQDSPSCLGDWFEIGVGAAPKKEHMTTPGIGTPFLSRGSLVWFDQSDFQKWPRSRLTSPEHKLLVLQGPTRKLSVCYATTDWDADQASRHLDLFMLPRFSVQPEKLAHIANFFDKWFLEVGEDLGLRKGGRWNVGIRELRALPLDPRAHNFFLKCAEENEVRRDGNP